MTQIQDAFFSRTTPEPMSGCWLWFCAVNSEGYGIVKMLGETRHAHRVAYELFVGDIPAGLQLDHKCRVRCCVNPAHLEPVTSGENTRRGSSGVINSARMKARTHCANGHPYSPENTFLTALGHRQCSECARVRKQKKFAAAVAKTAHESVNGPEPFTVRS